MHISVRVVAFAIAGSPDQGGEEGRSLVTRLGREAQRLVELAANYGETRANVVRKHSVAAHELTSKRSSERFLHQLSEAYEPDRDRLRKLPLAIWRNLKVFPIAWDRGPVWFLAIENPRDGFALDVVARELGVKVVPARRPATRESLAAVLGEDFDRV